jgi:hypothetical protein
MLAAVAFWGASRLDAAGTKTMAPPSVTSASTPTTSGGAPGSFEFPREHGPLLAGEPVTITEAEGKAVVHLSRPNSALASDATIRNVFYEERMNDEGEASYIVAIDYESGLIVYVHPASFDGPSFNDPEEQYREAAEGLNKALGSIATVSTVRGVSALVIERAPGGVASVDLVLPGGQRVQLIATYAPDMKADTVTSIAETLS